MTHNWKCILQRWGIKKIAKTGKNESMQANSKSSRRMLRFRYHRSLASSVVDICMKQVEFEHYSVAYFDCITAIEVDRSCLFPGSLTVVAFSPTWGVHILWYMWYPRMTPDAEKEHGTAQLRLLLPSLITMCLSFIHQRWQAMMIVHFWSQLNDPCDATIDGLPNSQGWLAITCSYDLSLTY